MLMSNGMISDYKNKTAGFLWNAAIFFHFRITSKNAIYFLFTQHGATFKLFYYFCSPVFSSTQPTV